MIIWVASYPKSGNTWVRSILSSLIYSDDGIFNINLLNQITQFPLRKHFENLTNDYENINQIKKYWILAQDKLNIDNKVKFLKTHHINCKIDDFRFTNKNNTIATIYIVRDPRNVVTSISNHFSLKINEAKNFLFSPKVIGINKKKEEKQNKVATIIGTWQDHFISWTTKNQNLLLIKYEDLLENTEREIEKIITFTSKFIKFDFNEKKILNTIKTTSFDNLKKIEKEGLFKEIAFDKVKESKVNFFNLGQKNKWERLLDNNIRIEIEEKLNKELIKLNYLKKIV